MTPEHIPEKDAQTSRGVRKTKTLYVREEDQQVWDQAREIVGDSLSTYITNHLKTLVASRSAAQQGFERIVLQYIQNQMPVAKAFYGRWLIPPKEPFIEGAGSIGAALLGVQLSNAIYGQGCFAVAMTAKNNVAVFKFRRSSSEGQSATFSDNSFPEGAFWTFPTLSAMSKDPNMPHGLIGAIMRRDGIEVQELDI